MKRKRMVDKFGSTKENENPLRNKKTATAGKTDSRSKTHPAREQRENMTVPLPSIFKRLYEGLSNRTAITSTGSIDEQIQLLPKTPRKRRNCVLGKLYYTTYLYQAFCIIML